MKKLPLLILVLTAMFILLITPYILNPELYTIYRGSSTSYHSDPATLRDNPYQQSGDFQVLMQDLLDTPYKIALNIKMKDLDSANRELSEYKKKSQSFDRRVVDFDLNESPLGIFRIENRKNSNTLERIVNESIRFDEINRHEAQYRSENNSTFLITTVYDGRLSFNALKASTTQITLRESDVVNISGELNLDTTQYREALGMLAEIVKEDQKVQEERERNRPAPPPSSLSLSVTPVSGQYGDILSIAGTYPSSKVQEITLVIDSEIWKTIRTDANGIFSTTLPIGMIREGNHLLFATTFTLYSNLVNVTIIPADTVLTLETYSEGRRWEEVFYYGELDAGEVPVSSAPVKILVDDFVATTVDTDGGGYYYGSLNLTKGDHKIQAVFDNTSFPLNPSESAVLPVTLSPSGTSTVPSTLAIGVGAGILLLALSGAVLYLRWRNLPLLSMEPSLPSHQDRSPPLPEDKESTAVLPQGPTREDILARYQALVEAGEGSEAAALLYRFLIQQIPSLYGVRDPYTLTPAEVALRLSATPLGAPFLAFIQRYEEVRYGGLPLHQADILPTLWNAVLAISESEKEPEGRA